MKIMDKEETVVLKTNENMTVSVSLVDQLANPGPLGLLAFGMTTVLLNFHNAGFYGFDSMILAMGFFYGGIAQIIAGIMEWKKNNTFGTTAFISYGSFWLTLIGLVVAPKLGLVVADTSISLAAYLLMWGIFTTGMFVCTIKLSRELQLVFFSLALLFYLLALASYTNNADIKVLAGYEGIVCGSLAIYTALSQLIKETFKK